MEFYKLNIKNNSYIFNNKIIENIQNLDLIDPSYDMVFKQLFSNSNEKDDELWKGRIKSLLKSLVINEEIKDIKLLRTENIVVIPKKEDKDEDKITKLISDLVFEVNCANKKIINVEMQISPQKEFPIRLMNYGITVKTTNHNAPIIILGFLNSKGGLETSCYSLAKFDNKMTYKDKIDGFIDAIIINLQEISDKLLKDEDIFIFGKKIDNIGKNWLKLLSLRHWAVKKKYSKSRFIIPFVDTNEEIKSAFNMLAKIPDELIKDSVDYEAQYWKDMENAKKEGILETFLLMYKNSSLDLSSFNNINLDFSNFKPEEIEKIWGDGEEEKLSKLKIFIGKKTKSSE